jgi:membrane-bound serine protease (ClpP class)
MTLAMLLIYIELSAPGVSIPGVLGMICLVLAFMSFQALPIRAGGVALLALGIVLVAAEFFVTTKGILAAGGVLSVALGLLWVFDPAATSITVSTTVYVPIVLGLGGGVAALAFAAAKTQRLSREALARIGGGSAAGLSGYTGHVESVDPSGTTGKAVIRGEVWDFESQKPVQKGDSVKVQKVDGFRAVVHKVNH